MTQPTTKPPTTREINWKGLVAKVDPDLNKPEIAYEFSNGRKFESSDRSDTGIYERS